MSLEILYETESFAVLNKPAGLLVHATARSGSEETICSFLLARYPEVASVGDAPHERPGIVHRLDRETSGALLVARTQEAFRYFKRLFQSGEVAKEYRAIVFGRVPAERGTITAPIGLKPGTTRRTTHIQRAKLVKPAVTRYEVAGRYVFSGTDLTYLRVVPETGRTHQVRVHMNSLHHPVLGDALYGGKMQRAIAAHLRVARHLLHAYTLTFTPPASRERLTVTAPVPADFLRALEKLSPAPADTR